MTTIGALVADVTLNSGGFIPEAKRIADTITSTSGKMTAAQREWTKSVAAADPVFRANLKMQQDLARQTAINTKAVEAGVATQQEAAAVIAQITAKHNAYLASLKKGEAANNGAAAATGKNTGAVQQLGFQLNDISTGLLSGQSPFQIMAQQGGQVFQVWQMNNNVFKETASLIGRLITPTALMVTGLLGGIALIGTAVVQFEADQRKLEAATQGLGRNANLTVGQLQGIAEQTAATSNVTVQEARRIETAFLQSGQVGSQAFGVLTAQTKNYANATGISLDEAAKKIAEMAGDPVRGIDMVADSLGGVSGKTRQLVQDLVAQGGEMNAQIIIAKEIAKNTRDYTESLSDLGKKIDEIKNGAWDLWDGLGKKTSEAYSWLNKYLILISKMPHTGIDFLPEVAGMLSTTPVVPAAPGRSTIEINRAYQANKDASAASGLNEIKGLLDAIAQKQKVVAAGFPGLTGAQGEAITLQIARYKGAVESLKDANGELILETQHGVERYLSAQQIRVMQDNAAIHSARAVTDAQKIAAATEQARTATIGQHITAGERAAAVDRAGALAAAQQTKAASDNAKAIDQQNKKLDINTRASLDMADAWLHGAAAAMQTKAYYDALSSGVEHNASAATIAAREQEYLTKAVADAIAQRSQDLDGLERQADAQDLANKKLTEGSVAYDKIGEFINRHIRDLELEELKIAAVVARNDTEIKRLDDLIARYRTLDAQIDQTARDKLRLSLEDPFAGDKANIDNMRNSGAAPGAVNAGIGKTSLYQDTANLIGGLAQQNPMGGIANDNAKMVADAAQKQMDAQKQVIDAAFAEQLIDYQTHYDALQAIEDNYNQAATAATQATFDSRMSFASDFFGNLASLTKVKNKELNAIGKAAAIVQATIDGVQAVQKALATYPPPWNIAMAAAVGAAAAANVASIAGLATGVVGLNGPGTGTSDSVGPFMLSNGESVITAAGTRGNEGVLAAMNAGMKFGTPAVAANANSRAGANIKIINNHGGAHVEAQQTDDGTVEIKIDRWWKKNGDQAVATLHADGNSKTSGIVQKHHGKRQQAG